MLRNMSFKMRMLLLIAMPLAGLLFIAGEGIVSRYISWKDMTAIRDFMSIAVDTGSLVHEIQKERGMSAGYIGSSGDKFDTEIHDQHKTVDMVLKNLGERLASFDMSEFSKDYQQYFTLAMQQLQELESVRSKVLALEISTSDALKYYSSINAAFIESVGATLNETNEGRIVSAIVAYHNFLQYKELTGIERAVLSNVFACDEFTDPLFQRYIELQAQQKAYLNEFKVFASKKDIEFLGKTVTGQSVSAVENMRTVAMDKHDTGGFGVDAAKWFGSMTSMINLHKKVEDKIAVGISELAEQEIASVTRELGVFVAIALSIVISTLTLGGYIFRDIIKLINLIVRDVKEATQRIGGGDLSTPVEINSASEMDVLADSLNAMADGIKENMASITELNREVEERKRAEEEIQKFSLAVEQSPVSIVITDTEGRIEYVNPFFSEVTGYSAKEVYGKHIRLLKSGMYDNEVYKNLWQTITSGKIWRGEFQNIRKNGETYWEYASIAPVLNAEGNIESYIGVKEDITVRKTTEALLQQSEIMSRTLLESTPAGIIELDTKDRIVYANPMIENMFGYTFEELDDKEIDFLLPGLHDYINDSNKWDVVPGLQSIFIDTEKDIAVKHKNGNTFYAEIKLNSVQTGDVIRTIAFVVDSSRRRQAEQGLEEARLQAEMANKAKSDFLANMSHEIRTPLTAIIGYTDMLSRQMPNIPKVNSQLSIIKKNGNYLLELINDILDLAKIESGKLTLEEIECSVIQIILSSVGVFEAQAQNKGIQLRLNWLSPVPEKIISDPVRLKQVIINIIGNSIKFTSEGSVTVSVRTIEGSLPDDDMTLEILISDTGIGIKPDKINEIFNPFDQADNSITRKFGGTGLGLTITKKIVNSLGGQIHVASTYGKGTTFTISIPIGPKSMHIMLNELEIENIYSEILEGDVEPSVSRFVGKILLVDDTESNQLLFGEMLRSMGLEVDIAVNGQEAVSFVEKYPEYDLVLTDLHMPLMDGYDELVEVRKINSDIPVIALTADAMPETVKRCREAGFDSFVSKPLVYADIVRVLMVYLESQENGIVKDGTPEIGNEIKDDVVPICPEEALKNLNVSMDSYLSVLGQSIDSIAELKLSIKDSIDIGNLESVRENAHALKNTAGTLAIKGVYALAKEIEQLATSDKTDQINDMFAELESTIEDAVSFANSNLLKP